MAPHCSVGCPQGWQSHPPALGFTLLPCQGLSIQGSKRESCICGFGFKSLFLRERCVCVLQAHLTDIQPRGGSAVKSLPRDIFAPLILFSVFLLAPGVGNFPQPKTRQKGEGGGERCTQHMGSWAWHRHGAAPGEGSTGVTNATGIWGSSVASKEEEEHSTPSSFPPASHLVPLTRYKSPVPPQSGCADH